MPANRWPRPGSTACNRPALPPPRCTPPPPMPRAGPTLLRGAAAGRACTPLPCPTTRSSSACSRPCSAGWCVATTNADGIAGAVASQRVIGDVHARVGIPVDLVTRGARAQARTVRAPARRRARQCHCVRRHRLPQRDHGHRHGRHDPGYTHARERSTRADAAYRLFSLVQNVGTERERQRALLLDWENALLYALAGHAQAEATAPAWPLPSSACGSPTRASPASARAARPGRSAS